MRTIWTLKSSKNVMKIIALLSREKERNLDCDVLPPGLTQPPSVLPATLARMLYINKF